MHSAAGRSFSVNYSECLGGLERRGLVCEGLVCVHTVKRPLKGSLMSILLMIHNALCLFRRVSSSARAPTLNWVVRPKSSSSVGSACYNTLVMTRNACHSIRLVFRVCEAVRLLWQFVVLLQSSTLQSLPRTILLSGSLSVALFLF